MTETYTLYHYWRSSCSWRVRWAMAFKEIKTEFVAVDLLNGETDSPEHRKRHPLAMVPVLEIRNRDSQGVWSIAESVAMLEYLEEKSPTPALLPQAAKDRAIVRQIVQIINADTQPIQNLTVQYHHSSDPAEQKKWAQHWTTQGLSAVETICQKTAGRFCFEDSLTHADLTVMPQLYNAKRQELDLSQFPILTRIWSHCQKEPSYLASEPDRFKPS